MSAKLFDSAIVGDAAGAVEFITHMGRGGGTHPSASAGG